MAKDKSTSNAPECAWCERPLDDYVGIGRPRRYCDQACRQAAYFDRLGGRQGNRLLTTIDRLPSEPASPSEVKANTEAIRKRRRTHVRTLLQRCEITAGPLPTPCVRVAVRSNLAAPRLSTMLHRMTYEYWVGPIPLGMFLDHLCQDGSCLAAEHLEPVTARENSRRTAERARFGAAAWLVSREANAH